MWNVTSVSAVLALSGCTMAHQVIWDDDLIVPDYDTGDVDEAEEMLCTHDIDLDPYDGIVDTGLVVIEFADVAPSVTNSIEYMTIRVTNTSDVCDVVLGVIHAQVDAWGSWPMGLGLNLVDEWGWVALRDDLRGETAEVNDNGTITEYYGLAGAAWLAPGDVRTFRLVGPVFREEMKVGDAFQARIHSWFFASRDQTGPVYVDNVVYGDRYYVTE